MMTFHLFFLQLSLLYCYSFQYFFLQLLAFLCSFFSHLRLLETFVLHSERLLFPQEHKISVRCFSGMKELGKGCEWVLVA